MHTVERNSLQICSGSSTLQTTTYGIWRRMFILDHLQWNLIINQFNVVEPLNHKILPHRFKYYDDKLKVKNKPNKTVLLLY